MYDFIDAVKKHHIIWDREHENFHNRELRDQAWQQIGQQLCKNFEAASGAEKQEIGKLCIGTSASAVQQCNMCLFTF